jgi:hypothetical protein
MCLEDFLVELREHIFWLGVVATPDFFGDRLASTLMLPALQPACHPLSSTPHRVKNVSGRDRLSFPFFFDPNFNAELHPIEIKERSSR